MCVCVVCLCVSVLFSFLFASFFVLSPFFSHSDVSEVERRFSRFGSHSEACRVLQVPPFRIHAFYGPLPVNAPMDRTNAPHFLLEALDILEGVEASIVKDMAEALHINMCTVLEEQHRALEGTLWSISIMERDLSDTVQLMVEQHITDSLAEIPLLEEIDRLEVACGCLIRLQDEGNAVCNTMCRLELTWPLQKEEEALRLEAIGSEMDAWVFLCDAFLTVLDDDAARMCMEISHLETRVSEVAKLLRDAQHQVASFRSSYEGLCSTASVLLLPSSPTR
jgi:hypothetical protein